MTRRDLPQVKEAIGIFFEADKMHEAVDELLAAGFDHKYLGLLAEEGTVREALGHVYTEVNESVGDPEGPRLAFVKKQSLGDTFRALAGSLFFAGATATAGAVVVSAGVLGGGLLAAASGVGAVGAVSAVLGRIIHQSDAEYLEEQVDEGHLLLFVRTHDSAEERRAMEILAKHCGTDVRIHTVPDVSGSEPPVPH